MLSGRAYWDSNVDGNYNGTNEGPHYYLQDADYNVTAVVNCGGTVEERYSYTPYGEVTVLDSTFAPRPSSPTRTCILAGSGPRRLSCS